MPATVAERSGACTVFARSESGIVGSNPTQCMDVSCVCEFFCVCVVLCLDRGLTTSWSPVQGVLPSVNDQETEKSALCSKKWEQRERKKLFNPSFVLLVYAQLDLSQNLQISIVAVGQRLVPPPDMCFYAKYYMQTRWYSNRELILLNHINKSVNIFNKN
jgi:hypothetical protein